MNGSLTTPPPGRPAAENPTRRVLFSSLSTRDVVTAVVLRLRAAIGLGLLADGERLPKESDLARQLGVSNFTLRAALEALRREGLITTRPGKKGGSFVTTPGDITRFARDDLRTMSTTELRDLGDWRRMLTSVGASLAAERASESNWVRLRTFADDVASAATEPQVRRAYGRFHIELAAAAQSTRMSMAELAMHEEFDWLLSLALADPEYRRRAAAELTSVADSVAAGRPDAARVAAEKHSASTIESLMKLRLGSIASGAQRDVVDGDPMRALADEVERIVDLVTTPLGAITGVAEDAYRQNLDEPETRSRLATVTMSGLLSVDFPVDGMGFTAEPGTVPGHEFWIGWWHRRPDGVFADDRHVMDPDRDDFYDYRRRDYFAHPRDDGRPWAEGPYVDYGGVDDYVLTFALPVFSEDRFVGVAAVDVLIASLEHRLAPWLVASETPLMVVNLERRVIVSNSARHIVGDVVPTTVHLDTLAVGAFGWTVATATGSTVKALK